MSSSQGSYPNPFTHITIPKFSKEAEDQFRHSNGVFEDEEDEAMYALAHMCDPHYSTSHYPGDIRAILTSNAIKDMQVEEDERFLRMVRNLTKDNE